MNQAHLSFTSVAVLGSGTMGRGIAQASALAGYQVTLYDIAGDLLAAALEQISASIDDGVRRGKTSDAAAAAAKAAFTLTTSLEEAAQAGLVIEAAPERLDLKQSIFRQLDAAAPPATILASNTSSLSINALAGATQRGDRFLGLHFFNPAHLMKLVEVINGEDTSDRDPGDRGSLRRVSWQDLPCVARTRPPSSSTASRGRSTARRSGCWARTPPTWRLSTGWWSRWASAWVPSASST